MWIPDRVYREMLGVLRGARALLMQLRFVNIDERHVLQQKTDKERHDMGQDFLLSLMMNIILAAGVVSLTLILPGISLPIKVLTVLFFGAFAVLASLRLFWLVSQRR